VSRFRASDASPLLIGAALAVVAFGASGGTDLTRTTTVELLLLLAGGGLVAAAVMYGPSGPLHGGAAVLALAVLAAFTGLSILWSIAPELSFVETGRVLAYLATFAGAVAAARLWPRASPQLVKGILLGGSAVIAYALASRVWPEALAENELSNRLSQPYQYWNAVAITGAMMVPPALWLGSRRTGSAVTGALAYPALGIAALAILLTQSRGGLAAAALAAAAWLAVVPLRLRSLPVLLVPLALVAPVAAWALSKDAFSKSQQPLSVKADVAGEFGLLVVLMVVLLLAAGLAAAYARERWTPSLELRSRIGVGAAAAAGGALVIALGVLTISGTIGDRFDELTSESAAQPREGAGRFVASSSSRGRYWRDAGKVFADRRAAGTGAGTFAIARLRYRKDDLVTRHAHGWVAQTLADLGVLGLLVSLGLLGAWLVAAAAATRLPLPRFGWMREAPRGPPERRDWSAERAAVACLALCALAFGLQSLIDWTWFVPGAAVMALAAAGFVAGRGPVATLAGEAGVAALPRPEPAGFAEVLGVRLPVPARPRLLAAGAVILSTLLCAWAVWQPERADRLSNETLDLVEDGKAPEAMERARKAQDVDPLSPRPLFVEATAQASAGDRDAARHTLERAVLRYPGDPQPWLRLATFQLTQLDRPGDALETLRGLLYLDPKSKAGRQLFLDARVRQRTQEAERFAREQQERAARAERARKRGPRR
jgi:hypothetical protein